jgi:hypothetical protein
VRGLDRLVPVLRFTTTIENVLNNLYAYVTTKIGQGSSLVVNDLISISLQFILIEEGTHLHGGYSIDEATWIAELFPIGKYDERQSVMVTQATCLRDGTDLTLFVDTDRDNKLIAYTIPVDDASTWFEEGGTVTLLLRVIKVDQCWWRDDLAEASAEVWAVELVPNGKQIGDRIICNISEKI